jgi:hypothetical protein
MQFNREGTGEIHFQRKVPRRFQEGFAEAKKMKRGEIPKPPDSLNGDGGSESGFSDAERSFVSEASTATDPSAGLRRRL